MLLTVKELQEILKIGRDRAYSLMRSRGFSSSKTACIREMKKKEAEWNRLSQMRSLSLGMTIEELCNNHLRYQVEQDELKPKSIDRRECTIDCHIAAYIGDLGSTTMQYYIAKRKKFIDSEGKEKQIVEFPA